jgi:hypothetical protein
MVEAEMNKVKGLSSEIKPLRSLIGLYFATSRSIKNLLIMQ